MAEGVNRAGSTGDGRSERWRAHRRARRAEFVEAAFTALAEHGPRTGMAEIAAAAGVSKTRLYRHFTDQAELLGAVVERASALIWARLEPALTEPAPLRRRVRQCLEAYIGVVDEHPQVFRLIAARRQLALPGGDPVAEDKRVLAEVIAAVLRSELLTRDGTGAELWAHGIVGAVESATEWWLSRRTMSRESLIDYLSSLVLGAIEGALGDQGVEFDPDRPTTVNLRLITENRTEGS